jgi:hypothetical protein
MDNKVDYQHDDDEYGDARENEVKCDNCFRRILESKALFYFDRPFCSKQCLSECGVLNWD